jgi:hypothetical protein
MYDTRTDKLLKYIEMQIVAVNNFDETKGKKGVDAKIVAAHKKGYIEALQNVEKVIKDYMKY